MLNFLLITLIAVPIAAAVDDVEDPVLLRLLNSSDGSEIVEETFVARDAQGQEEDDGGEFAAEEAEDAVETDEDGEKVFDVGDMIMDKEQFLEVVKGVKTNTGGGKLNVYRNGIASNRNWPGGVVPYRFKSEIDLGARDAFEEKTAMLNVLLEGCITFRPANKHDGNGVVLVGSSPGARCSSGVGHRRGRPTTLRLPSVSAVGGCVVHELLHAVGFFHEHVRPDRDTHITVDWTKINAANKHNWSIYRGGRTFGEPYNVYSILHYSPTQNRLFAVNEPGVRTEFIKRTRLPARTDLNKIRKMYHCPMPVLKCDDPSYTELEGICFKVYRDRTLNFEDAREGEHSFPHLTPSICICSNFRSKCESEGARLYEPRDVASHLALEDKINKRRVGGNTFWTGARVVKEVNSKSPVYFSDDLPLAWSDQFLAISPGLCLAMRLDRRMHRRFEDGDGSRLVLENCRLKRLNFICEVPETVRGTSSVTTMRSPSKRRDSDQFERRKPGRPRNINSKFDLYLDDDDDQKIDKHRVNVRFRSLGQMIRHSKKSSRRKTGPGMKRGRRQRRSKEIRRRSKRKLENRRRDRERPGTFKKNEKKGLGKKRQKD